MKKNKVASVFKKIFFCILSFVLSLVLFALSVSAVLSMTFFDMNSFLSTMKATSYYEEKKEELINNLTDLTYPSGLKESFFEEMITTEMISGDTLSYITGFFDGSKDVVDDTVFKQSFSDALDKYIADNNIKNVNPKSMKTLIKKAGIIYSKTLSIPLLRTISTYFHFIKKWLYIAIIALACSAVLLILILMVSNRWLHRKIKYICFATSGTFLSLLGIAVFLTVNGGISHIQLESLGLYNFLVHLVNGINIAIWFASGLFLVISVILFVIYSRIIKETSKR